MSETRCPSFAELIDRASGVPLPAPLEAHRAAGCPDCVRRDATLAALLRVATAPAWPSVPETWLARAVAIPEELARTAPSAAVGAPVPGPLGRARELFAALVRDVRGQAQPALALRGPGPAERHYLYEAGPYEIDVALMDSGALVGHVLANDGDAGPLEAGVCVLYGAQDHREAALEATGDFHFVGVAPGAYDLLLETPALRLFVRDLDLRAQDGGTAG